MAEYKALISLFKAKTKSDRGEIVRNNNKYN